VAVHPAILLLEGKAIVLSELLRENVSGQRRKLRKKLENGTRRTRGLMSNLWFERKAGEENAGIHDFIFL
jgi:t-SNARE complex subunit (syntaxin)